MNERSKFNKLFIVLMTTICCFVFIYLYMYFHNQDTLEVGIYCGSTYGVPGTEQYKILNKCIEKFHTKYPNIKVHYEEGILAEDYSDWLSEQILKGCEPDVYIVLKEDFTTLLSTKSLMNLNDCIIRDDDFDPGVYYDSVYNACKKDTITYALPFTCNPKMMFVNRSILRQEGIDIPEKAWNWDEFYRICKGVVKDKDGDGVIDQFAFCDYNWLDATYSNGIAPFDEEGIESNFTDQKFMDAISYMHRLEGLNNKMNVSASDFDLGNVAFRPMSFAEYRTYMPYPWRIKKFSQFEWTCAPMPAGPYGDNNSIMDVIMLGMSSRTNKKKMAWEFMKMLTNDEEIQYSVFEDTAASSVLKGLTISQKVMDYLNEDTPGDSKIDMTLLDQTISKGIVPHYFMGYDSTIQFVGSYISDYLHSDGELSIAMYQLKNEVTKLRKQ